MAASPTVQELLHSGKYARRPRVEIFTEHSIKGADGKIIEIDKARLEKIAEVGNKKAARGNLSLIGPGHTYDDEYGKDGKLVKKFPEDQQPRPWGAMYQYVVAKNPHGKYSLYVDEYVEKEIVNPQTGKKEDGLTYTASFPRRSAEIFHSQYWIDWVASLRRAPELDMGLALYEKSDPDHVRYANFDNKKPFPAIDMGNPTDWKTRYSADTAGEVMGTPRRYGADEIPGNEKAAESKTPAADMGGEGGGAAASPTELPSANGPGEGAEAATDGALPPEHMEAAEKYSMHVMGMHHTRQKALMQHMHSKYGAECGMDGNMMSPHTPGGAPASASTTSAAPSAPHTPPEKAKMSKLAQDQDAIEKSRYAKELADVRAEVSELRKDRDAAREAELHAKYEQQLLSLVWQGYEIDADKEMEFCKKRKYSKEQFEDHLEILKRMPHAPTDHGPAADMGAHRQYQHPQRVPPNDPQKNVADNMDGILAVMRRDNLAGEDAFNKAKTIYEKERAEHAGVNGSARR